MTLEERIETFSLLGKVLRDSLLNNTGKYSGKINSFIRDQKNINQWFTSENVRFALNAVANELTEENLRRWTGAYPVLAEKNEPVTIGLIFAGNIPMAGFHDFLTVLISGNHLIAKTSSKDPELIPFFGEILNSLNPGFTETFRFTTGVLSGFDAVIATGSNNSSRYFEYYFEKYPGIIRKNRNSIAIIDGSETAEEIEALGKDIFTYFGLGCRNVSKIFIPEGYDFRVMPEKWASWSYLTNHSGYANNYDYNKAVLLVNRQPFHDAGFLLMKEENRLTSPVSVLYFETYSSKAILKNRTDQLKDNLQCIIGKDNVPFGESQTPHLWDYADEIDTMEFLLKKNTAGIL
jgi:hypothetical protein